MPAEDRRIIFTHEETYKALYALCSQKQIDMPPPGKIDSISAGGEDMQIEVVFDSPQSPDGSKVTNHYSRDFVASAVMLFCRGLGIPLPKGGTKSVMVDGGQVVLRVLIG